MTETKPFDYESLDPGIRDVVRELHVRGWHTTDSGDGSKAKTMGCALDVPMIAFAVDHADWLISEANYLNADLAEIDPDRTWHVEASYSPGAGAFLVATAGEMDQDRYFVWPDLIRDITAWQRETFPQATVASAAAHLHRETIEVLDCTIAAASFDPIDGYMTSSNPLARLGVADKESIAEECADVMHLLIAIADLAGFDLFDALAEKFAENKARKWKAPDAQGVVEHE